MVRKSFIVAALVAVALFSSSPALADDLHLCNIDQFTTCNAGSVISVFGSLPQTAWVFGQAASNETLFIAVLTPQTDLSGQFQSGGNLWTLLGISPTQTFPNFSSTHDQELGATGINANSFSVSVLPGVAWTGSVNIGQAVTLPNEPIGTIFIAFLEDSNGNLIAVSPWSSSLIFVPEPSSLMLLGTGLLALGALASRRLLGN